MMHALNEAESLRPIRDSRSGTVAHAQHLLSLMRRAGMVWPVSVGAFSLGLALLLGLMCWLLPQSPAWIALLPGLLSGVGLLAFILAGLQLYRRFLRPLAQLEESLGRVCQGEPGARVSVGQAGALAGLVADIDSLNEELADLYEDMDNRVARQTRRLAQKTASLNILYQAAASITQAQDLTQLLIRYLRTLKDMVNGRTATVYLREPDDRLRLVGSAVQDNSVLLEHEMLPLPLCRCGRALVPGEVLCEQDAADCSKRNGRPMYGPEEVEAIEVPLAYHGENLGIYRIFVDKPGIGGREDVLELLTTIGTHLGMAIAKQRSDAEARRLSIIEERNHLAHELHDSLAQTLASLRFQVRMLQETLAQDAGPDAVAEAQRIRNSLDEAHAELREMLDSFRTPVDQRGLVPSLEKLVDRFSQETGLRIFFQRDCRQLQLRAHEEMQMLRIVQESLANIRKHARAHAVRVLLRCRAPDTYLILVEDDGIGFERSTQGGRPGEHIGLSIMEDRARHIGAELRIESEPGEGTRVELLFKPGRRIHGAAAEVH